MVSTDASPGPSAASSLAAPATPLRKERRRSWFGLVTPKRKDHHAPVFAATREILPDSADSSTDDLEELDVGATGPRRGSDSTTRRVVPRPWADTEDDSDFDSDLEGTVRRPPSSLHMSQPYQTSSDDGGRPRQKDLTTLAILSRSNTVKPKPFASRLFSRTASDSDSLVTLGAPSGSDRGPLTPSKVPARVSSVNASISANLNSHPVLDLSTFPPHQNHTSPVNKPLPELKPLPDLPPNLPQYDQANGLRSVSSPVHTALPPVVITPSSPKERDPFENLFGLDVPSPEKPRANSAPVSRSPSTRLYGQSDSRSGSPTPDRTSHLGSTLGLGLPESVRRSSAPEAPHLVSKPKPQAVSSPLPMRSPTPNLKVTFNGNDEDKLMPTSNGNGKDSKPRPRSISAFFARSPVTSQEPTDDESSGTKLGWLGLSKAKTIRRRRSEAKLAKKRSGFFTDYEANTSTDDQREADTRPRNASTPMLITTSSSPSKPMTIPGRRPSASSSHSSLDAAGNDAQQFWPAVESPAIDIEMMDTESDASKELQPPSWKDRTRLDPTSQRSSLVAGSPLGSLPELGPAPTSTADFKQPVVGRGRSQSDAARRIRSESTSLSSSPLSATPDGRPGMARTNSGNSIVLGKVRNVFAKSRPRSNSALRQYGSTDDNDLAVPPRPGSSASNSASNPSFQPSPALPPVRIRPEDVPQVSSMSLQPGEDDRRVVLTETPDRSPRSSYAASLSSRNTHWTQRSHTLDTVGGTGTSGPAPGRARASTISSAAISYQGTTSGTVLSTAGTYGHGSSTHVPLAPTFPTAATPPRQRSGSIRRLSTGLFKSNPSSPRPPASGNLFPLPPRTGSVPLPDEPHSRGPSPIPGMAMPARSVTPTPVQSTPLKKEDIAVRPGETPESWLERMSVVNRRELAGVLAVSGDKFYIDALKLYMERFDFTHIALDVALRRLLMHMSLPKETQQIDRVMEAFASRYDNCEPGLFGAQDNGYVLAFSMMMLHTDAFNRHNKNKMTKADYVRNTRLDGVHATVLEVFFDNITFTPFVFIEDDYEAALAAAGTAPSSVNGQTRSTKIDVYDLIVGGQLGSLRVDIERLIPANSPFSCMGTKPFLDIDRMQWAFANAHPLQFVKNRTARRKSVSRPMSVSDPSALALRDEFTTLKVTKVGLISRKDDSIVNGKRATGRKWKSWSVILTGSQLLFFKDTIWALTLVEQIRTARKSSDQATAARMTSFQPDEVLSVKDCVAVFDREYTATPNTFRFVMPNSRDFLMQATDEGQMNEWLSLINYASTFKSAGIRMRAAGMDSGEAVKAGTTAAELHRHDLETGQPTEILQTRAVLFADAPQVEEPEVVETPAPSRPMLRRVGSMRSSPAPVVDVAGANAVVEDDGEQREAVIGSVKAELAAGRGGSALRALSPVDDATKSLRTEHIMARVQVLKSAAAEIEKRLAANLRIARNLGILTPFQKASRERVDAALPELAQHIRTDRMDLSKHHLWITLLLKDQDRDQRDWARVRHVALQAAAKTLRTDLADRRATTGIRPIAIPKLSLPGAQWDTPRSPPYVSPETPEFVSPLTPSGFPNNGTEGRPTPDSGRTTDSRTSDSDYELARDYVSSSVTSLREEMERQLAFSFSEPEVIAPSPLPGTPGEEEELQVSSPVATSSEESAEHWRHTRAATKVSLAQLPRSSIGELSRKLLKLDDE